MKTKVIMSVLFLLAVFEFNGSAQEPAKTMVLSKPALETRTDNLDVKVWLIAERSKLPAANENPGMGSRVDLENNQVITEMPELLRSLPMGTHYITIHAKEIGDAKEISDVPKLIITSPSNQAYAEELKGRGNSYAASLILKEKGEYNFELTINVNGVPEVFPFKYTVN